MPQKRINGIMINFEIKGQGPNLVLIHGLGSSLRDWEYQIPVFAQKYRTIAIDLRGHGQSGKPKARYSIKGFAEDIIQLLNSEQIDNFSVLGISMGAAITYQLAIDYPNQVSKIIAVNMAASLKINSIKTRFAYWKRTFVVKILGMKKIGEIIGRNLFPLESQQDLQSIVADRWAENEKGAYLQSMDALKNWSVENSLQQMQCPALILTADQDYTSISIKQAIAEKIPLGELKIIQNAHHAVPIEKPEEFNQIVLNFLDSN
ncbi:alpha/beta fold hydrolase [Candidatus Lokiarchaeum ossiferum]